MTIREITDLRRNGHLDEALQAAETEFQRSDNVYTANAMFWCLNALYKTQSGEDAVATIERMRGIYKKYGENDEIMNRAMNSADTFMIPHSREIREAVNNVKESGNAIAIYNNFASIYESGELHESLYGELGWLVYYALKNTPLSNADDRKKLLNTYLKLNLERPSVLHSLILSEAIKVEQNTPLQFRIRDFIRLWGLDNLRDDDWEQFHTDTGHTLPSRVEKLIGVFAKELKTDGVEAPEDFAALVDKALERFSNNQNMPYFKATVLMSQGRRDEAVEYYRDLILRFPSKSYLWGHLAALTDDVDTKAGLLSKAITSGENEQFLGGVRLRMAALLLDKFNEAAHAKYELEKYRLLYQSLGWGLKPDFWNLYNRVDNVAAAEENDSIYSRFSPKAEDFIYSRLPEQFAVKVNDKQIEDRRRQGRRIQVWTLRTANGVVSLKKPASFGLDRRAKNGSVFSIRVHGGRIVWIKRLDSIPDVDWIKQEEGIVRFRTDRNGRPYAIIKSMYVGAALLNRVEENQRVKILALKQDDGRWSAVFLNKID